MNSRNQSLDVLRGIAILMVLGAHFRYFTLWRYVGRWGVDLFFVLSGFLISGPLFSEYKKTGTINYWRFFLRRGLKIWPSYYLLIVVMTLFTFVLAKVHGVRFDPQEMVVSAVFLRNYVPAAGFNLITLAWSLAVEDISIYCCRCCSSA